jgi:hypothetical protein
VGVADLLGCPETYGVALHDRYGRVPIGPVLEPSRVEWSRAADETSEASVEFAVPECCAQLGQAEPWCHDVSIYRDADLVWQGPLLQPVFEGSTVTLYARDVTAWLDWRTIHAALDFTASGLGAQDLVDIAEAVIADALSVDDPNVLPYLHTIPSGITGERSYAPDSTHAGDELRELARTGVDFTAIGRRIILSGGGTTLGRLATLHDEHFAGPLRIIKDGLAALTRAVLIGEGVTASSGGAGECGLLERVFKEDSVLDVVSAQAEANARAAGGYPTPVFLEVPDNARLTPDAPVSINQLVPGVLVPVASTQTCLEVATVLRLTKLSVSYTPGDGETVGVTLAPPGAEAA